MKNSVAQKEITLPSQAIRTKTGGKQGENRGKNRGKQRNEKNLPGSTVVISDRKREQIIRNKEGECLVFYFSCF